MKKGVKVNYPKKRERLNLEDLGDVSEPERCSMYQVLQSNLRLANRTTFLHRIIYVGAHKFPCYDEARNVFGTIIAKCNETYCLENLSGFLLYYYQFIVHMVEGDEDNLNKHIGYLLNKTASHYEYLGTIKLLIHVSNINQRFFEDWTSYTGVPSKLLEKLDVHADLQQSGRCIYNCIKKIYTLIGAFADDLATAGEVMAAERKPLAPTVSSSLDNANIVKGFGSYSTASFPSDSLDRSGDITIHRDYKFFLPEYELLEFVVQSNFTMKLQEYFDLYGVVPMRDIYKDRVWPVPHDFIPYDVFERPFNCVTELAKGTKKRAAERTPTPSIAASLSSFASLPTASKEARDSQPEGSVIIDTKDESAAESTVEVGAEN